MKFCSLCGEAVNIEVPQGDNRDRHVCSNEQCGTIHYQNPRVIAGVLPFYQGKVLLCKRAIEPRRGYWTLPAGFLENGETVQQGAFRESWEEAGLQLAEAQPYRAFDLTHINQIYMMFLAEMPSEEFFVGEESLEVRLYEPHEIPWDEIAFPIMAQLIKIWLADMQAGQWSGFSFEIPAYSFAEVHQR